jgi:hypothetical protein
MWRRVVATLSTLVSFTIIAYCAAWIWSVDRLDASIREQGEILRGHGWTVVLGPVRRMGWPAQARIEFGPASLETTGLTFRAESVTADVGLLRPRPVTVQSVGHSLRFGSSAEIPVLSREISISRRDEGAILTGSGIDVPHTIGAAEFQMWIEAAKLTVTIQDLQLLSAFRRPAPPIDTADFSAELTMPLPHTIDARTAAMWRDAGGAASVSMFHLRGPGMTVSGHAAIKLDAVLQPSLDGMAHIVGYGAILDGLMAADLIKAQTVMASKAVLDLLVAPSADGGVDIPVQIKDGVLTVSHFALLRLPLVKWPAAANLAQ